MSAIRQDAWTPDDDLILAEVTLRHIREGGTQLKAFEEVGERIGRTPAACGFRWNSCVRKKYEAAIQIAKEQRQKRKKAAGAAGSLSSENGEQGQQRAFHQGDTLSIDRVIRFLRQWKNTYQEMSKTIRALEKELKEKREEVERLRAENEKLTEQMSSVQTDFSAINEDYKALLQIMDRARKMAFLTEEDEEHKPRFKMDASGNLERIE